MGKLYFIFCLFLVLSGCTPIEKPLVNFMQDMDNFRYWLNPAPVTIIQDPAAFSGKYVCRLDSVNLYSPTFQSRVKDISNKKLRSLTVSGWFKLQNNFAKPQLVIEVKDMNGVPVEVLRKKFEGTLPGNMQWTQLEINVDITIKNRNNSDYFLRIYAMNDSEAFILLDDLNITFD